MLPGPPELEERYRQFLDGRGDVVDPLLFFLRGERHARAETGAWAALILSRIFFLKGNVDLSLSYLRVASARSKHSRTEMLRLGVLVNRALILKARGKTREAANLLRGIVDRAITSNEIFVAAKAASNLSLCMARLGDTQDALSYIGLAERSYSALGYETGLILLTMTRSIIEARRGMFDEAIERIVGALNRCDEDRFVREKVIGRLLLAEIFLNRGELEKARSALDGAGSMEEALRRFGAQRCRYYCLERELNEKTGNVEESRRFMQLAEGLRRRFGIALQYPGALNRADEASTQVARESLPRRIVEKREARYGVRASSERRISAEGRAFDGLRVYGEPRAYGETRASVGRGIDSEAFVTCDAGMAQLLDEVRRTARLSAPLLLQGESGTGKDLIARLIHIWSGREGEPFVPVNVAALPVELFESMTFGHAKGAFTGAACRRPGLIESAGRGTLFLDEIGELSPAAQAKLLRLVDRGEFIPLGETMPRRNEARMVAATNRNLKTDCASGRFRADLYYRLAALTVTIPPLRERRADIAHLALHLLERMSVQYGLGELELHEDVLELLSGYDWPGNARELESEILKAALKAGKGTIRICHLSPTLIMGGARRVTPARDDLRTRMNLAEKAEIIGALCRFGGNRSKAALALGLKRTTLVSTMKRLGIDW
jgi:DNA-binding NtrC family response regulator/tetratricopeptide (TPR) repeat protein